MIGVSCWTIRVVGAELDWHTFALQARDGCFLSGNTKLVARDKAVALSSKELAQSLRDAVMPTMQRRHGEMVELIIEHGDLPRKDSGFDDELIRARIAEGNFAPNKRPAGLSLSSVIQNAAPRQYLCILDSQPCRVIPKGSAKPKTGKPFTFRLSEPNAQWQKGLVGDINQDGSFSITLISSSLTFQKS